MENNALRINDTDNVVIATHNIKKGESVVASGEKLFEAVEDIEAGHKIAIAPIGEREKVYRYGEPIVETTRVIRQGEWVHVHNTEPIAGELTE